MGERLTNWPRGYHGGDQKAVGDRQILLQTACQQPQPELEQTQVAPILPMQSFQPVVMQRTDPQIHHPDIRQARGDQ